MLSPIHPGSNPKRQERFVKIAATWRVLDTRQVIPGSRGASYAVLSGSPLGRASL